MAPTENQWRMELKSPAGCAILSQPYSTIFSHLMSKSVDEIEQIARAGVTPRRTAKNEVEVKMLRQRCPTATVRTDLARSSRQRHVETSGDDVERAERHGGVE